jgi:hypothetical protein
MLRAPYALSVRSMLVHCMVGHLVEGLEVIKTWEILPVVSSFSSYFQSCFSGLCRRVLRAGSFVQRASSELLAGSFVRELCTVGWELRCLDFFLLELRMKDAGCFRSFVVGCFVLGASCWELRTESFLMRSCRSECGHQNVAENCIVTPYERADQREATCEELQTNKLNKNKTSDY